MKGVASANPWNSWLPPNALRRTRTCNPLINSQLPRPNPTALSSVRTAVGRPGHEAEADRETAKRPSVSPQKLQSGPEALSSRSKPHHGQDSGTHRFEKQRPYLDQPGELRDSE